MLKISIENGTKDRKDAATLKLEGRVAGPWGVELARVWQDLWRANQQKPLLLDICNVTFVDQLGASVLREIVRATGAEILADSPMTRYFASQARRDTPLLMAEEI